MADGLVFPPAEAARLPFPPGCSVSFIGAPAAAPDRLIDATVQSAFIVLSSDDRTTNYFVLVDDGRTATVSEAQLRFAIDCPVRIIGGGGDSVPGTIISRPYSNENGTHMYSAQVVNEGQRGEVMHSLTMKSLQYRDPVGVGGDAVEGEDENGMDDDGVPTEVVISTTSNSLDGSAMFTGDVSEHQYEEGGAGTLMNGDGGSMPIPRKAAKEDKENGNPNTSSTTTEVICHIAGTCAKKRKMEQCQQEESRMERLRVPSFLDVHDLACLRSKLKQLGDETSTHVEIEEGETTGHGRDRALYIAVGAKDSQSDIHRCCFGVEDLLYERLPDCLSRALLFDIMVFSQYGIFDASRVPWEGRTPGTSHPLVVYVERGPDFIRPKTWLGIVSIPCHSIGEDWEDSVCAVLLGPRGRKHQELLRQFPGSRISVVIRDDCRDFPHVSIESFVMDNLIGAMHHIRGELSKIMVKKHEG